MHSTKLLLLAIFLFAWQNQYAQLPIQNTDKIDAAAGPIVTNWDNTVNISVIFSKSPEYAEFQRIIDRINKQIEAKTAECAVKSGKKNLADCETALHELERNRDSILNIESQFLNDVVAVAEALLFLPLQSERLIHAKKLYDEGRLRDADSLLVASEIEAEAKLLLSRGNKTRQTDSLLRIHANELSFKALLRLTNYADSTRYNSALFYFEQSRTYAETVENLWCLVLQYYYEGDYESMLVNWQKATLVARSEAEKARLFGNIGAFCGMTGKATEEENYVQQAAAIYESLVKKQPGVYEADLARTYTALSSVFQQKHNTAAAEDMLLRAVKIYDALATAKYEQYGTDLARTVYNLASFYGNSGREADAEIQYQRSLNLYQRLAEMNPRKFAPDLAERTSYVGDIYATRQNFTEAERLYRFSIAEYEKIALETPQPYEAYAALVAVNVGLICLEQQRTEEAEAFFTTALKKYEPRELFEPMQFDYNKARINLYLGYLKVLAGAKGDAKPFLENCLQLMKNYPKWPDAIELAGAAEDLLKN